TKPGFGGNDKPGFGRNDRLGFPSKRQALGAGGPSRMPWGTTQPRRPAAAALLPPDLAQELARIVHAPVLPHLQMHVRAGGAAGRAGLGDLLAHAHEVADL